MAVLSRDEISSYAQNAGFTGDDVNIAVAVALAESGGNPDAHNGNPPDDSYGLWQINMYGDLGPSRRAALHISDNQALYTPAINARAAKYVFDRQGWKGWTTYTSGKYKSYLDGSSSGGGIGDTVKNGIADVTGLSTIASSINAFGKTLFNGVASVVAIMVALTLLVVGIIVLSREHINVKKHALKLNKTIVKNVKQTKNFKPPKGTA